MEKIIREVNARLQQLLPTGKNHLTISDFRAAGFPEPLIDRIQLEIFHSLDRSLPLPRTDWVDMNDSSVQQAWTLFMQNLRNHSHLPTSQKTDILNNAIVDVIHQLVEPRVAIPAQLFGNQSALTYEQLQQRAEKIVVYRHLVVGLTRYMDRRNLSVLPIEKCKDVLAQIDHKFCEDYTPMNWAQLLTPWFAFFGKRVPVSLLRQFFADKRNNALTEAFPESLIDLNKTEVIERLSAPNLPVSYHKMDDPEREQKLAQRIQPLENAGTYYEEFLKLREANRQKWATIVDNRVPSTKLALADVEFDNPNLTENGFNLEHAEHVEHTIVDDSLLNESDAALNDTFVDEERLEDSIPDVHNHEQSVETAEIPEELSPSLGEHDSVINETLNEDFEADVPHLEEPISEETANESAPQNTIQTKPTSDLSFHDLAEEGVLDELDNLDELNDIDALMDSIQREEEVDLEEPIEVEAKSEEITSEEDELERLLAEQEEKLKLKMQKSSSHNETELTAKEEPTEIAKAVDEVEDPDASEEDDSDFDMDALFAGNTAKEEPTEIAKAVDEEEDADVSEDDDSDFDMDALFAGNTAKEEPTEVAKAVDEVEDADASEDDDSDFDMDALFAGNTTKEKPTEVAKAVDEEGDADASEEDDSVFDMDALFAANSTKEEFVEEEQPKAEKATSDDINALFSSNEESENESNRGIEGLFSDEDSTVDDVLKGAAKSLGENEGLLEFLVDYHDYFIRELFDGNAEVFSQCIEDIDSFSHWPEASEYLNNDIFSAYGIDMISEPAIKLIDELQTYFSSYKVN